MSAILLKFVHVVSIAIWSGGLVCLPFLYLQRKKLADRSLYRLHNFTRFFYVGLVSPAAFVAVASGITLIFVQATFEPWFSVKLAMVAALVLIHVTSGAVILRLFEPGGVYPAWRFVAVTILTSLVVGGILVVVLGKPQWAAPAWLATLFVPGTLGAMLADLTAWSR